MSSSSTHKKQKIAQNQYSGYIIPSSTIEIATIDLSKTSITPKEFFSHYISQRKPVKLINCSNSSDEDDYNFIDVVKFQLKYLESTLNYNIEPLQVEELFKGGFGLGQKRIDMKLSDLIHEFEKGDRELYLTTQYDREGEEDECAEVDHDDAADNDEDASREEDPNEEEEEEGAAILDQISNASSIDMNDLHDDFDDFDDSTNKEEEEEEVDPEYDAYQRVKTLYQPPLTNLAKATTTTLPTNPPLIPNLIPQQINIWMGKTSNISTNSKTSTMNATSTDSTDQPIETLDRSIPNNGTSSGLHHDHADNLYILVQGRKRFTIFSPADALKLFTVGKIHRVFSNGVIDYKTDCNFPNWRLIRDDGAMIEDVLNWQMSQTEDEKEIERLSELLDIHEMKRKSIAKEKSATEKSATEKSGAEDQSRDPPSFSQIPPCLLHIDEVEDVKQQARLIEFANTHFPGFLELNKMSVWLDPGDMLYLPASWFHEVSSFGVGVDDDDAGAAARVHIALNYWFVPPNNDDFKHCYKDLYWEQDWQETKKAIEVFQQSDKQKKKE